MRFRFERVSGIPALAWCAHLRRGSETIEVVHGPWVDTRPDGFFEGAWDGPFGEFGFGVSIACMGTGARLAGDSIEFVAPTHSFRWLPALARDGRLWISNSIAFLLVSAGDAPEPSYPHYPRDLFAAYNAGIVGPARTLPTRDRLEVQLHHSCNLVVGRDLEIRRLGKAWPPPPAGFEEYRTMLEGALDRLRANAADAARAHSFRPIALVSRGYDSPACAALGVRAGWKEAFTLGPEGPLDPDDDGTAIAERLGLSVTRKGFHEWRRRDDAPEAEFLATSFGNVMVRLSGLERELRGTLALQGGFGDVIWERTVPGLMPDLSRPTNRTMGHPSTWEFELRAGIVFVYPPTIGAIHVEAIRRIGKSAEMKPWSLGGTYDRPVARRILEEAGVPGGLFGVRKMANSHDKPEVRPSASGAEDYERFLQEIMERSGDASGATGARDARTLRFQWAMDRVMRRYRRHAPSA